MMRTIPLGPVARLGENVAKLWWEQIGLPWAAWRLRADVLHCPYLAAPLIAPCPVVVTAHDLIPWAMPAYRTGRAVRLYLALAAAASRRARLLLTDSESARQDVLRYFGVPLERVRTVLLGIEPGFGDPPPPAEIAAMRARFGLPEQYAFYIGGYDMRKDVPTLLRAWAAALPQMAAPGDPPPVLALAGRVPTPGGLYPDVVGEATRLGLTDPHPTRATVRFLGRVSEADKRLLLAGASLFAFPSRYEGFGYDPLEAMAAGVPVLAADATSLPEVVGTAGRLLPPGDVPAWAAALAALWRDPAARADLAARSRAQAARFDPARTAAETLAAYVEAGNGKRET
jgi:glycosyltransferase involved in cell wall biosynthesis